MAETVRRALAEVGPLVGGSLEVLIVNDGSTDRTPELADALAAANPRVRVHHQANRGYGGALRAGFEAVMEPSTLDARDARRSGAAQVPRSTSDCG